MKNTKIPIGWLIPIAGLILLLGWFLGRSGWNITEVDGGIVKLAPPTATLAAQITTTEPAKTSFPVTMIPTVTPLPTTRPPTSVPFSVRWLQEIGQIPERGTQLTWDLSEGQVMLLSGGQFQLGNVFCGGDVKQICVLIYKASTNQTVSVNSLIPRQNYVGITESLSPDEALEDKEPLFWIPPNCISGCQRATVLFFENGVLVNKVTLTAP